MTTIAQVRDYVVKGWPSYISAVNSLFTPYFEVHGSFTYKKNLVMYQNRIVILISERTETLRGIHEGHLSITKYRARANRSGWWPGMSREIEEIIKSCSTCWEHASQSREPLLPTATPERPWQIVGSDLFCYKRTPYLLVVDYYSRHVEIAALEDSSDSSVVITKLKSIFARHGIPEMFISDNGPQHARRLFKDFALSYAFQAVTSSPAYSRANG